jgi:hypothetical protein
MQRQGSHSEPPGYGQGPPPEGYVPLVPPSPGYHSVPTPYPAHGYGERGEEPRVHMQPYPAAAPPPQEHHLHHHHGYAAPPQQYLQHVQPRPSRAISPGAAYGPPHPGPPAWGPQQPASRRGRPGDGEPGARHPGELAYSGDEDEAAGGVRRGKRARDLEESPLGLPFIPRGGRWPRARCAPGQPGGVRCAMKGWLPPSWAAAQGRAALDP